MIHPATPIHVVCALVLAASLGLASCTSKGTPTVAGESALPMPIGKAPLQFDYQASTELVMMKNDATAGDRWSARFVRKGTEKEDWEIVSAPDGRTLIDRQADGGFILHLLDTLTTYSVQDSAPNGPLSSFGLDRPAYDLRWKSGGVSFELRVGAQAKAPNKTGEAGETIVGYWSQAVIDATASGGQRLVSPVALMTGAAIAMLSRVESFDVLRHRTWATSHPDDVDEMELRRAGKPVLWAERGAGAWSDRRKRKLSEAASGERLEGLMHARILEFVDDRPASDAWAKKLATRPEAELVGKGRAGEAVSFRILNDQGKLVGSVSTRPGAVFVLYPEVGRFFVPGDVAPAVKP